MAVLSDLVSSTSRDDILDGLLALLHQGGFPIASWNAGSVIRHLVEMEAFYLSDLSSSITTLARAGYLDTAEGMKLDALAEDLYQIQRKGAVKAEGTVRLTDSAGGGPIEIVEGTYWFTDASRVYRFVNTNTAPITVPLRGYAAIPVRAEFTGSGYNLSNDTITEIVTPGGSGLTVTNPPLATNPVVIPWLTIVGTEEETDAALRQRCRDRWSTLGTATTEDGIRYSVLSAHYELTRAKIVSNSSTGYVTVYVASPLGPVSDEAIAAAQTALDARTPLCMVLTATNCTTQTVEVRPTVRLKTGYAQAPATTAITQAINHIFAITPIGGTIYTSHIVAAIQALEAVHSLVLTLPAQDVSLGASAVGTPVIVITYA